jgi:hypothetical protein
MLKFTIKVNNNKWTPLFLVSSESGSRLKRTILPYRWLLFNKAKSTRPDKANTFQAASSPFAERTLWAASRKHEQLIP